MIILLGPPALLAQPDAGLDPDGSALPLKRVLLLFPYQPDFPKEIMATQVFLEEFQSTPDLVLDVYHEYLDLNRFQSDLFYTKLVELLKQKYGDRGIDLVILGHEASLDFWLTYSDTFLPDTPAVVYDIAENAVAKYDLPPDVSGIITPVDTSQTLKWIVETLPDVNEIVVVQGTGSADQHFNTPLSVLREGLPLDIRLTSWQDVPLPEIEKQAADLPPTSVIYYQLMFEDATGARYRPMDVLDKLTAIASIPVVCKYDIFLGHGTIGGYMMSVEQETRAAAQLALRILRGEPVETIPVQKVDAMGFIFDHEMLKKWDIPLSALPAGSTIKNRQFSLWELYRFEAVVLGIVVVILFIVTMILGGLNRKLRRTRQSLNALNANLEQEVTERTARLTESRDFAEQLIETANAIIVGLDLQGRVTLFNSTAETVTGYKRHEVEGQNWFELIVPRERYPDVWAAFLRLSRQEDVILFENPILTKDGEERFISWRNSTLYRDKEVVGTLSVGVDLTERRRAEEALRESEERLKLAIEGTGVGLWDWNVQTGELVINEEWANIIGYSCTEFPQIDINIWVKNCHQADLGRSNQLLNEHFKGETERYECEARMKHRNGHWVWVLDRGKVVEWTDDGKPLRMTGTHLDITERKRAEEALQETARRLNLAKQVGRIGVWDLDLVENRLVWDDQMYAIYGVSSEQFGGAFETWRQGVHPDDREEAAATVQAAIDSKTEFHTEFRIVRPNGDIRYVEAHATVIYAADETPLRMVGINLDITERKRAEMALQTTTTLLQEAQRIANVGSWQLDVATGKVLWTDALYLMLGLDPDQPPPDYKYHSQLFTPESWELLSTSLAKTQATGEPYELELETVKPDGTRGWMLARGEAIRDKHGVISELHGVALDITERKKTEKVIEQQTVQLKLAQEMARIGYWSFDILTGQPTWSDMMYEVMGCDPAHGIPHYDQHQELIHPDDWERFDRAVQGAINGTPYQVEIRVIFPDNSLHWVTAQGYPQKDANGEITALFGTTQDITKRKRAEIALQENEQKLRSYIENSPHGIFITDGTGRYIEANEAACKTVGYPREELIQLNVADLMTEMSQEVGLASFAELVETGKTSAELQYVKKDGTIRWWSVDGVKLNDDRIMGFTTDITERKEAETALLQAKQEAERANQAKSIFLANMSHDLRTPLNGILGYAQLLKHDPSLNHNQHQAIETIERSGHLLLNLINDILDLAKIEAGKTELIKDTFDLSALLSDVEEMMRFRAEEKDIQFSMEIPTDLPSAVIGDEKRLNQVLSNLVGNAIKFTQSGSVEFIVTHQLEDLFRFEIRDTGPGIEREDLDKLFQPFQRVGESARMASGTGLGLVISQNLVQGMGGKIRVETEPGKGSVFWFDIPLPAAQIHFTPKFNRKRKVLGYVGARRQVLVVDDKASNREAVGEYLKQLGFHVMFAQDGLEAVQHTQNHNPDLVIMDLRMPTMNGLEAIRRIRTYEENEAEHHTPIIASSASVFREDRNESITAGADVFLQKPVDFDELVTQMGKLMELEWVWDTETPLANSPQENTELKVPPEEDLRQLVQAVQVGNYKEIQSWLAQAKDFDSEYLPFVKEASHLIDSFQLNKLSGFLEYHLPTAATAEPS